MAAECGADLRFHRFWRQLSWLLPQDERDRGADEVERLALFAGRLGEHGDSGGRAGEQDLVAGQGTEVGEQAAEAAVGAAGLVVLAGCLRVGVPDRRAGATGSRLLRRVLVGVGQRCPGLAQVPGEVGGEHADQHVALDALFQPVEDGPQVQVVGFDVPEVAFDVLEVLVGGDRGGGIEGFGGDGSADDVDPVEGGFLADLVLPALDGQAVR